MFLLLGHPISIAVTLHVDVSSRKQNCPDNSRALLALMVKEVTPLTGRKDL
jgi:hypothetical protein